MTTTSTKYTPEQVSQMSDADLSEAVGREAFGAVVVDGWPSDFPSVPTLARFIEGHAVLLRKGSPLLHLGPDVPTAVLAVLEHMRQRWAKIGKRGGWRLDGISPTGDWWVSYCEPDGGYGETDHEEYETLAPLGRAVFTVALLASQEMET